MTPGEATPTVTAPLPRRTDAAVAAVAVLAGMTVLLARPFVAAPASDRTLLFGAAYLVIGGAAVIVPATRGRAVVAAPVALAIGVAAIVAAGAVTGPVVPAPWAVAALPLSLLAAVAEEALFRRVAYARLERFGALVAIVGSAALFTLVHLPAYGLTTLPVDAGAALLFGWQRWASGTWTVPAATHAFANLVAVLR
jgi:membrane protease YdiL (CAAX protease family)